VRQPARLLQLCEAQLRVVVTRIEFLDAQVDRIGAVRDGGANRLETPGGGEELRHRATVSPRPWGARRRGAPPTDCSSLVTDY
jgi:hypothetical protein